MNPGADNRLAGEGLAGAGDVDHALVEAITLDVMAELSVGDNVEAAGSIDLAEPEAVVVHGLDGLRCHSEWAFVVSRERRKCHFSS